MPTVTLPDGAEIYYRVDDFTDPWRNDVETVFLVHGFCRNSDFWYAWVPTLARQYRVVRWDARGVGRSTKPPSGYLWSLEGVLGDLADFLDAVGVRRCHFVGESMGGMILPYFAVTYPARVASLVVCSSNLGLKGVLGKEMAAGSNSMADAIRTSHRIEDYIRATEPGRLNPQDTSKAMRDWYCHAWASTPRQTWEDWSQQLAPAIDITPELLSRISVPVLYLAASGSARTPLDEARTWTENIPNARLALIESRSQALAMVNADECARLTLEFLCSIRSAAKASSAEV